MSMKHTGKFHAKAAAKRRDKMKTIKDEKRALRVRLDEAKKAQG